MKKKIGSPNAPDSLASGVWSGNTTMLTKRSLCIKMNLSDVNHEPCVPHIQAFQPPYSE